jgi:hypothetical protein
VNNRLFLDLVGCLPAVVYWFCLALPPGVNLLHKIKVEPLNNEAMEKIMIAGIIALFCLTMIIPGKPWVTPNDLGPEPVTITVE